MVDPGSTNPPESSDGAFAAGLEPATRRILANPEVSTASLAETMSRLYDELHSVAGRSRRGEGADRTLNTTALVHEAYVRLVGQRELDLDDRARFLAAAAETIHRILTDDARKRLAARRGGDRRRILLRDDLAGDGGVADADVLALDEALAELRALDERQARVVQLRFFAGMSVEEVAHVMGLSERTVKGDWAMARAWLRRRLGDGPSG